MGKTSSKLTCDFGDDAAKCVTVAKGKFQTDADVAGWGVLIAFAAGSFTTLILCLILAVRQYLELFDFFGCCSGRSSRGEKATRKRRDRNLRWVEQVVQDLIISLSDQQIVTGLSLAISIRYSRGCDVSAYHYNIIANLILMTMTTHVSAILVLPEYFDNLLLATLRIVAITLIVVWSGLLFINQQTLNSNPVSFPTAIPELGVSLNPLDTVSVAMLLPAACYQSANTRFLDSLGDLVKTTDNFRNAILGSVANGRFVHGYSQWIFLTLMYALAVLFGVFQRALGLNKSDSNVSRWIRKIIWMCKILTLGGGCWIAIYTFIYIRHMRRWLDRTEWYEPSEDGKNPENNFFTFGQLIPVFMLSLIAIALIESGYSHWQEKRHQQPTEETTQSTGHGNPAFSTVHHYP